jgi:hypothetical protein
MPFQPHNLPARLSLLLSTAAMADELLALGAVDGPAASVRARALPLNTCALQRSLPPSSAPRAHAGLVIPDTAAFVQASKLRHGES